MVRRHSVIFLLSFVFTHQALACGEITPNKAVTKIVTRLAYSDFPKAADILAIIRIESEFNPRASNESERESSHGLMQVQNGPFDIHENIAQGTAKLREYFMLTHSIKGAIESYNIGPQNWLHRKLIVSGEAYYDKYSLQRRVYANYPAGKIVNLGKSLGCGRQNGIPDWLRSALRKDAPDSVVEAARRRIIEKH